MKKKFSVILLPILAMFCLSVAYPLTYTHSLTKRCLSSDGMVVLTPEINYTDNRIAWPYLSSSNRKDMYAEQSDVWMTKLGVFFSRSQSTKLRACIKLSKISSRIEIDDEIIRELNFKDKNLSSTVELISRAKTGDLAVNEIWKEKVYKESRRNVSHAVIENLYFRRFNGEWLKQLTNLYKSSDTSTYTGRTALKLCLFFGECVGSVERQQNIKNTDVYKRSQAKMIDYRNKYQTGVFYTGTSQYVLTGEDKCMYQLYDSEKKEFVQLQKVYRTKYFQGRTKKRWQDYYKKNVFRGKFKIKTGVGRGGKAYFDIWVEAGNGDQMNIPDKIENVKSILWKIVQCHDYYVGEKLEKSSNRKKTISLIKSLDFSNLPTPNYIRAMIYTSDSPAELDSRLEVITANLENWDKVFNLTAESYLKSGSQQRSELDADLERLRARGKANSRRQYSRPENWLCTFTCVKNGRRVKTSASYIGVSYNDLYMHTDEAAACRSIGATTEFLSSGPSCDIQY